MLPLDRAASFIQELSAEDIKQGISRAINRWVPTSTSAVHNTAGLKSRKGIEQELQRLGGKILPATLPLVTKHSQAGTGNIH